MITFSSRKAFTLIELLLVIGIIAILASIVIVAINPTKQLGDARNAQRRSDVNTIINAVYQYAIDHEGQIPSTITTTAKPVCMSDATDAQCTAIGGANLRLLTGSYLVSLPKDPGLDSSLTGSGTRYMIVRDGTNRITVSAPAAEQGAIITVSR